MARPLPSIDDAKKLGATLNPVDATLLRQPARGRRRWWRGGEAYLECTVDDESDGGSGLLVEVYVRSRFARYTLERGLETGGTDEGVVAPGGAPSSRTEARDKKPDKAKLKMVKALLWVDAEGAGVLE